MDWAEVVALIGELRAVKAQCGLSTAAPLPEVHVMVSSPDAFASMVFDIAGCMNIEQTHVYNLEGTYQWTHKSKRH